jgi:hypothetical protein
MDGLYDRDFVLWAEAEAAKLRRLRDGERVNDVDWENLIEEVESLGRSETRATQNLLYQAVSHALKVMAWPEARHRRHWLHEAHVFLRDARRAYAPSMTQKLRLDEMFEDARRRVLHDGYDGTPPMPLPGAPWFTLSDLLAEDVQPEDILARAPRG